MEQDSSRCDGVEQWRPVVGFEGRYEVSDQGRVRSVLRSYRIRRCATNSNGYRHVLLRTADKRSKTIVIHRLVVEAFQGSRADGEQIRHLNGDQTDNRLANLVYGSATENALDQVRHGRHLHARKTHCAHGHPYDAANTYWHQDKPDHAPRRQCRTCRARRH